MSNAIKYLSMSFSSTIDFEVESLFDFEYLIWMVTISFFAYIYIYIYKLKHNIYYCYAPVEPHQHPRH